MTNPLRTFRERPPQSLPASGVVPTQLMSECRELDARMKDLTAARGRNETRLERLRSARVQIEKMEPDDPAALAGLPLPAERLARIDADLGRLASEQSAVADGLRETEISLNGARRRMSDFVVRELRDRCERGDALMRQVEQLHNEMDLIENCARHAGVHLPSLWSDDPVCWGGWTYFRNSYVLHPDGRRTLADVGSEYSRERDRKVRIGMLPAAAERKAS